MSLGNLFCFIPKIQFLVYYKLTSFAVLAHFHWWLLLNCCRASFFQQFYFFPLPLQDPAWKMEFDNIKSSAALIYDEFIQNAGEF